MNLQLDITEDSRILYLNQVKACPPLLTPSLVPDGHRTTPSHEYELTTSFFIGPGLASELFSNLLCISGLGGLSSLHSSLPLSLRSLNAPL
jgi:hypothetical protein